MILCLSAVFGVCVLAYVLEVCVGVLFVSKVGMLCLCCGFS